jgi:hypothetical protein
VGAAFFGYTPAFGISPALIESFSSLGGTPILFNTAGNRLTTPEVRQQPAITAPDGGNTSFLGSDINYLNYDTDTFPNFFGTSAAAPHAAGVAALMLEHNSSATPDLIYSTLESTALDMGATVGFDFATGYGLIQADAALAAIKPTLTVTTSGNGTVTSSSGGINCGTTCSANFNIGTLVTLTATPAAGSTFTGWSGACTGSGSCQVTMNAAKLVTAPFNITNFALNVTKNGTGTGTVTSTPAGINCGTTCSANYASGTSVSLSAVPATGSTFTGWSGPCIGTGSCVVSITAATNVTATFDTTATNTFLLTVSTRGSGQVTSNPVGISCGTSCIASYPANTTVTLTATAISPARFQGWEGDCSGSRSTCVIRMSRARNARARFGR